MNKLLLLISLNLFVTIVNSQSTSGKYKLSEAQAKVIVQKVLKQSPVIDGHNDMLRYYYDCKACPRELDAYPLDTVTVGHTDIIRWKKGGVGGQLLNVFGNTYTARNLLDAYDLVYRMTEKYKKDLAFTTTAADVKAAIKQNKIAIIPSMEFSVRLENSFTILRIFHKLGLRAVTLAYQTNDLADGSDDTAKHNGLSLLGREMVEEMNRIGVMVDISHVSEKTMQDVLEISKAPVIFSHSNVKALTNVNRNVPDDVLLRLKQNGGIIMLTFVPYFTTNKFSNWVKEGDSIYYATIKNYPGDTIKLAEIMDKWERESPTPDITVADMADHFDYVKKLIGVDHIGMAGDYDGISHTIKGLEDVSTYPNLLTELARRGWTEAELKKITGENFLRVFEEVEKKAVQLKKVMKPAIDKTITSSISKITIADQYKCPCDKISLDNTWADTAKILCYLVPVDKSFDAPEKGKHLIAVALVKSTIDTTTRKLLYLHGGPGIATIENIPRFLKSDKWQALRKHNDIIFFDYRGTGYSEPALCETYQDSVLAYSIRDTLSQNIRKYAMKLLRECRDALAKEGVDLSTFTSFQMAADADAIRNALGIQQWNVYGVSYGTTVALNMLRSFSKNIQAVVLDSPYPPNAPWKDHIRPFDTAFKVLQKNIAKDPGAAKKFSGLRQDFVRVVRKLNATPVLLSYKQADGTVIKNYYNGDNFAWSIWRALLNPKFIPVVPLAIHDFSNGNVSLLQEWSNAFNNPNSFGKYSELQNQAITCFEDRPFSFEQSERYLLNAYPDFASFNSAYPTEFCNIWRPDSAKPLIYEPVYSNVPVLVLGGEYDPVTPPFFGELAAKTLKQSKFINVPAASHAAMFADDCTISVAVDFLRNPEKTVNINCVKNRKGIKFITSNLAGALKNLN